MLRSNDATPDPFGSRPRAHTAPAERSRFRQRAMSPTHAPLGTVLTRGHIRTGRSEYEPDWTSNTNPRGISAVDDGRGRLILSGTNARLFLTSFPSHRSKSDEERVRHEHRIEHALRLDRAKRMLPLNRACVVQQERSGWMRFSAGDRVSWNGAGWARSHRPMSMLSHYFGLVELGMPNRGLEAARDDTRTLPAAPFR